MRILLVEDDEVLSDVIEQTLTDQHYIVETAPDGQTAWDYAQSAEYELLLIDVGLPLLDGITLCQRLRSAGNKTPILLMTAKDASQERIRGLDAGADDYLTKPFDLGEFQARVRALLRRKDIPHLPVLEVGELRLDPASCQVTYAGNPLNLTPKEYSLLELFLRNPSRVFSRGQIVEQLWSFDDPPLEESVKAHIKGLRKKLKAVGADGWIENVYGIGYRLSPQVNVSQPAKPASGSERVEQQFNHVMGQLWQRYGGLMAERLGALQQALTALESGTLAQGVRHAAERAAHKLAGVLGMFEQDRGTQLARQIEHLLQDEQLTTRTAELGDLVQQLQAILNPPDPVATPEEETAQLLLIDAQAQLGTQLQQLAIAAGMRWAQVDGLAQAKNWLRQQTPDAVALTIDTPDRWQEHLALVSDLAARTPPVPVLVLATADSLVNRVMVARAGGAGFLVKPVTATQVWDAVGQLLQQTRSLKAHVLVVDDDPVFLAAIQKILTPWGMRMTGLDDPRRFWQVLQSTSPDLLILDVQMPDLSGIELCRAVRTDPDWQELPILFLTAHQDRTTLKQVFAAGADDYVTKPVVEPELITRIANRLERSRQLRSRSRRDPITGLANQRHSRHQLATLLRNNNNSSIAFALLRVAQLRQINIRYGHDAGNQVLQTWGHLLQTTFRGSELLGDWGHGEFLIAMPGLTKAQGEERLSDFLVTLRQQVFTAPDGSRFQVDCCHAVAHFPTDAPNLEGIYRTLATPIAN